MQQKTASKTNWACVLLGVAVLALTAPNMADAKRLGGGSSAGRSASYAKPANNQAFGQGAQKNSANPQGATQANAQSNTAAKAQAAPAAQAAKRNWLGPVMGIAAGLGLAALFSSMGLGAGLAQVLTILLLVAGAVLVGVLLLRFLRGGRSQGLALQGVGGNGLQGSSGTGRMQASVEEPVYKRTQVDSTDGVLGVGDRLQVTQPNQPASDFDVPAFLNNAKQFFATLQGLNDTANWPELRRYCSEELWQHFVDEAKNRAIGQVQRTEIMRLDAELISVEYEDQEQVAAVSYNALVREDETSLPQEIQEVWTLIRPRNASSGWVLAGIQAA